jgi:hypothetical protein
VLLKLLAAALPRLPVAEPAALALVVLPEFAILPFALTAVGRMPAAASLAAALGLGRSSFAVPDRFGSDAPVARRRTAVFSL